MDARVMWQSVALVVLVVLGSLAGMDNVRTVNHDNSKTELLSSSRNTAVHREVGYQVKK